MANPDIFFKKKACMRILKKAFVKREENSERAYTYSRGIKKKECMKGADMKKMSFTPRCRS